MAKKPTSKPEAENTDAPIARPVLRLRLDKVIVPPRLRKVDPDLAAGIADSMAVNGQQTPIEVSPKNEKGKYTLIAGAHRIDAARLNEWEYIEATIFEGSEAQYKLREIDENLIRRELSPLDKSIFLAERKKIFEELYPESKAGVAGAAARWHANAKFAFASETAEKCGISERYVQLAIQRFNRIAPDVRERIALTWIADKGVELDALAKLDPDEQRKAVKLLLSGKDDAPKSVGAATKVVRGVRAPKEDGNKDADFEKFIRGWNSIYSAQTKKNILAWLEAEGHISGLSEGGDE
jgi:Predicted transcriptional regulators